MQRLNILLLASTFALLVLVFGLTHALKQHPPYTPQVNTEQQADSTLKGEENPKTGTQSAAKPNQEHGGKYSEQGENEGTEFWPPFLGIRLKITDSLLALFTAGLLIFTGLLWRSTDKLWAAGERQFRLTRVIPCGNLATRKLPIKLLQGPPTPQLDPLKLRRPLCSSPSDLTYSSRLPSSENRWIARHSIIPVLRFGRLSTSNSKTTAVPRLASSKFVPILPVWRNYQPVPFIETKPNTIPRD